MEIIHLTNENFKELIKEKILVDFYANWCGPCKMIAPELERVESNIKVVKVDVDEFEELAKEYGVMSIPTLILFNEGKEIKRNIGFLDKDRIKNFID
jgi:thioredoxin 1